VIRSPERLVDLASSIPASGAPTDHSHGRFCGSGVRVSWPVPRPHRAEQRPLRIALQRLQLEYVAM